MQCMQVIATLFPDKASSSVKEGYKEGLTSVYRTMRKVD